MRWIAVGIAILMLAGGCSDDSEPEPRRTVSPTHITGLDASLVAQSRQPARDTDSLAVCVSGIGEAKDAEVRAKGAVEDALLDLSGRGMWDIAGFAEKRLEVVIGRPFPPAHYGTDLEDFTRKVDYFEGRLVNSPSYFHVFVFVLPQNEVCNLEGNVTGRRGTEEIEYLGGDQGQEATIGLYVGDQELDDQAFLEKQLAIALSLEQPDYGTTSTCPG
jgi:hypothetical protein